LPEAAIARVPGPPYYGQLGTINPVSIARQEDYWIKTGTVKKKIDGGAIIDSSIIEAARAQSGIH
jgi:hypothetical protein